MRVQALLACLLPILLEALSLHSLSFFSARTPTPNNTSTQYLLIYLGILILNSLEIYTLIRTHTLPNRHWFQKISVLKTIGLFLGTLRLLLQNDWELQSSWKSRKCHLLLCRRKKLWNTNVSLRGFSGTISQYYT